jgi:predicted flap endonuclease-1-like 5' DNA nuclease
MLKKSYSKTKPVCKVTFTLPFEAATNAQDVRILGEFNNWSWENGYRMKADKSEFVTEVELEAGKEYQFRYLIDNHIWENDWAADNYVQITPFGIYNSVVSLVEVKSNGKAAAKPAEKAAPVAKAAPAVKAEAKPAAAKVAAPKAAKATGADDLTKIEGIGPKIAELLKTAGIVTFADLSNAKTATLKGILDAAGKRYQMHDPATWPQQAGLAAKGEWAKLEKLQGELKGGKH